MTVTAPGGTLHELFFDPVTVGSSVLADGTNGVLKPASFTDANGASATIGSISYEPPSAGSGQAGIVKLGVDPHTVLANHIVDIIELDGTVSLSLRAADATVDSANDTLTWSVSSQPWHDRDKLMVRIHKPLPAPEGLGVSTTTPSPTTLPEPTQTPATATPSPTALPEPTQAPATATPSPTALPEPTQDPATATPSPTATPYLLAQSVIKPWGQTSLLERIAGVDVVARVEVASVRQVVETWEALAPRPV